MDDVDAEHNGRTALWEAVFANCPDNARALIAAGADPWRPMMGGWFDDFARVSAMTDSSPEAVDLTEAELVREVLAAERQRLAKRDSGKT
ncbi:hypothetical protein HNP84_000481 [Thermocatellispora tengchongensis]|uniref:Ankyrin repeat domain-containing protein n=1 Tax=Thermocatellispora tengchongensis TaxID=1073253 RepID=A0A840NYL7_9ACTN|nr:ankyrin repeat domain-containing protein [Thermocatellispora tengchongensis]MBB5130793.1 hypothetical protein [Thermocatellispora tengchongensis]